MPITRQADYAIRAVLDLALQPTGARVASVDIARRQGIPLAFLFKILARLAAEGLVYTQRGARGGTWLAGSSAQITLLQVVEAIDGPFALNRCARQPCDCVRNQMCVIHPVWFELCCEFRARLASYTFATIAAQTGQGVSPASSLTTLFEALPLG